MIFWKWKFIKIYLISSNVYIFENCKKVKNHLPPTYMYIRVEWFWKIKIYTFYVVPKCCRTPNKKLYVFMLPLSLVAGPLNILTVTLKWAKQIFLFNIFKGFIWNKICSLAFLNAKTEEILLKNCFTILYINNRFVHFWKIKNILNKL